MIVWRHVSVRHTTGCRRQPYQQRAAPAAPHRPAIRPPYPGLARQLVAPRPCEPGGLSEGHAAASAASLTMLLVTVVAWRADRHSPGCYVAMHTPQAPTPEACARDQTDWCRNRPKPAAGPNWDPHRCDFDEPSRQVITAASWTAFRHVHGVGPLTRCGSP